MKFLVETTPTEGHVVRKLSGEVVRGLRSEACMCVLAENGPNLVD